VKAPRAAPPAAPSDVYRNFHDHVVEISKLRLDEPKNITRAQALLVEPNVTGLSRGWIAAFAQVAAQSPKFAQGVQRAAARRGAGDLVASMAANPAVVFAIDGAADAEHDVVVAVARESSLMNQLTYRLSEIAYGRTAKEAELAHQAQTSSPAKGVTGATESKTQMSARATPLMSQILALGAVVAISKDASFKDAGVAELSVNAENDQCLRWAKLNLAQCLAAVHDGQERAYCLAQHGLDERAKCWSWVAQPAS
jgi:hypothetical protein